MRTKYRKVRRNPKTRQWRHCKNKSRRRMVGGWDNQRYYQPLVGLPPINADLAIRIGKFLINDELPRYFLNEDDYYGGPLNAHFKRLPEPELVTKLKIRNFKNEFKNDDDYEWVGRQFYFIIGNQNPFHGAIPGYSTFDDGVSFFDWLTNTPPRNNHGLIDVPSAYQNPLEQPVTSSVTRAEPAGIPAGIVNDTKRRLCAKKNVNDCIRMSFQKMYETQKN